MGYRGLTVMEECPRGVPGTRQRIRRSQPRRMSGIVSVCAATLDVGLNSFDVQLDNGGLSFVAEEELQGLFAIHKTVLRQAGRTCGLAEDGEICFLVRIIVAVVEAHLVTVEDSCCSLA